MSNQRLLILGLDGLNLSAPGSGALKWMPRLSDLLASRKVQDLPAIIPNNSVACWTSWFCGCDPSHHAMVDFVQHDPASGFYRLSDSSDRAAQVLWEMFGAKSKRCVVFNVPGTYPATSLNGVMIAGSPIRSRQHLTWPKPLNARLEKHLAAYRSDLEFDAPGKDDPKRDELMAKSMVDIMIRHLNLTQCLLSEDWDLFIAVQTMTDRLLHHFYPVIFGQDDDENGISPIIESGFRRLDEFVEKTVTKWRDEAKIFIVSDHGFQPCLYEFHIADWLEQKALFVRKEEPGNSPGPNRFDVSSADHARSLLIPAPASSMGLRFNDSIVESKNQREEIIAELEKGLNELRAPDGQSAIDSLTPREKLYSGPHLSRLPDLLLQTRNGQIALTSKTGSELFTTPERKGMHSLRAYCAGLNCGEAGLTGRRTLIDSWHEG
jgi:predicted AlkP superfamily phosphohydrolase/phosphomutase